MRRRIDVIDRMLERWASWRMTEVIYTGTGPSSLVRFSEPATTTVNGTRLLYCGRSSRRMGALNSDLISRLGHRKVNILLMLYGLPGDDQRKVRQYGICADRVSQLRHHARVIALQHLPASLTFGGSFNRFRTHPTPPHPKTL